MLTISGRQIAAFEAAANGEQTYGRWLEAHRPVLGDIDIVKANEQLDAVRDEAKRSGIDTDKRLYTYAAARMLMPNMTSLQYFKVMDLVFAPMADSDRMQQIVALGSQRSG